MDIQRISIECKEGFTYVSYQKIKVMALYGPYCKNISRLVVDLWNTENAPDATDPDETQQLVLGDEGRCFFVLSGESFTISDLGEKIAKLLCGIYRGTIDLYDGRHRGRIVFHAPANSAQDSSLPSKPVVQKPGENQEDNRADNAG